MTGAATACPSTTPVSREGATAVPAVAIFSSPSVRCCCRLASAPSQVVSDRTPAASRSIGSSPFPPNRTHSSRSDGPPGTRLRSPFSRFGAAPCHWPSSGHDYDQTNRKRTDVSHHSWSFVSEMRAWAGNPRYRPDRKSVAGSFTPRADRSGRGRRCRRGPARGTSSGARGTRRRRRRPGDWGGRRARCLPR